jgi:hypothetical protein
VLAQPIFLSGFTVLLYAGRKGEVTAQITVRQRPESLPATLAVALPRRCNDLERLKNPTHATINFYIRLGLDLRRRNLSKRRHGFRRRLAAELDYLLVHDRDVFLDKI